MTQEAAIRSTRRARKSSRSAPTANAFADALQAAHAAAQAGVWGVPGTQRVAFAALLVNRLILLKFIEAKGCLDNDRNYLTNRLHQIGAAHFWRDLCRLNSTVVPICAELFAPVTDWDDEQLEIDAAVFPLLFERLLNPYQFTCDTPSPHPDVCTQATLGYAYETLIADQHGNGAYYTHPTEVTMMCRTSLRSFLELRCPHIDKAVIAALLANQPDVRAVLPPAHARDLYIALHTVTICDPAAGTGMFLIAMLQQIVPYLQALGELLADDQIFQHLIQTHALTNPQDHAALHTHIITHCLFGCDIDTHAIQIARLRLWVALLAACDTPRPLPNLAYRLRSGEALIGAVGTRADGTLVTLDAHVWPTHSQRGTPPAALNNLVTLHRRYLSAPTPATLANLSAEIAVARTQALAAFIPACPPSQPVQTHILWPLDFAEVFQSAQPGFDIVIGNPPYLRQELIDAAYAAFDTPVRKRDIQALYQHIYGCAIKGTADLYVYFFLRGLALLRRDGGTLCYICSNSWLDVDYGATIRQAIIDQTASCTIYDNQTTRSFSAAAVNTAITLLQTTDTPETDQRYATFAACRVPFEQLAHAWAGSPDRDGHRRRDISVTYDKLRPGQTSGSHWGGQYLRSPDIYRHLMAQYGAHFVPLQSVAALRFGIKTGANAFFHLDQVTIAAWGIEYDYLTPIVRTPRECASIVVDPAALQHHLLVCHADEQQLVGTRVRDYIRWGESRGFHQRPSCRSRARWYDIGGHPPADFVVLRFRDMRNWTPLLPDSNLAVGDTVFVGTWYDRRLKQVSGALLNSTLSVLMSEVFGRSNLGDGLLTTYGPDILALPLVNPHAALAHETALTTCLHRLAQRSVRPILEEIQLQDRRDLDAIVFDILGLMHEEREAVYAAVADMTQRRIQKAQSRRQSA